MLPIYATVILSEGEAEVEESPGTMGILRLPAVAQDDKKGREKT